MPMPATTLEVNGAEPRRIHGIPHAAAPRHAEQGDSEHSLRRVRAALQVTQGPLRESAWTLFRGLYRHDPAGLFSTNVVIATPVPLTPPSAFAGCKSFVDND